MAKNKETQNLFVERVFDPTLAQASYVIADKESGEAIVIDPKRDIDTYLDIARENSLNIKYVTETHIHADFLSGAQELAVATGAELLLSGETVKDWTYEIPHTPLKDGDGIAVGKIVIETMHTPGHTPESLTFLLLDPAVSDLPQKAFTGDFIFVGDVGRPDLLEKVAGQTGSQEKGAEQLYASLKRFSKLPGTLEIWPGHGAGSFCGKALSDAPGSTLKDEMENSPAFAFQDGPSFIRYILEGQPAPPKYFAVMKTWNRVSRPLRINLPGIKRLKKEEFLSAQKNQLIVVDTRPLRTVVGGHIPGSLQIEGVNTFSTFIGSIVDYRSQLVLIAAEDQIESLERKLTRIGMDNIYGYVSDIDGIGVKLQKTHTIGNAGFEAYSDNSGVEILDVRSEGEYKDGHVPGAKNIPYAELEDNLAEIDSAKPVIVYCKSGVRANMAYSILQKNGITNSSVFLGEIDQYLTRKKD